MQESAVFANLTFEEILDDLSSRFIINVPEAELSSVERICFQVEQAHWFYEDFIRELRPELPSFQLKSFSARIFKHCPLLHQWAHEHERAYADFMQYRFRIPVCGAIILNATLDKCVLVKGWSSKSGWGFPKGKINQDEEYDKCAIREVLEETGYDVGPLLKKADYIELTMREQRIRLYIIQGVPEDTQFIPRTRKEISQISWIKLDDLPTYKTTDSSSRNNANLNYVKSGPYRFYMVVPFINKLRQFVNQRKKAIKKEKGKSPRPAKPSPRSNNNNNNNNNKPAESSLKSLLGVNEIHQQEATPTQTQTTTVTTTITATAATATVGPNLLDQLFASSNNNNNIQQPLSQPQPQPQQLQQQQVHINNNKSIVGQQHRASFVEELLRSQQQQQQQQQTSDNVRRNSLLSVLQGGHRPSNNNTPESFQQQQEQYFSQ
ncbi:MAG: Dcp2, box A domain-containing protein [Benjaminiella poitrasii]|nr:MAG: Dcp2, box A domain-containing protein [Benjaminiella poitrasii]